MRLFFVAFFALAFGCAPSTRSCVEQDDEFIAFASHFDGFRTWEEIDLGIGSHPASSEEGPVRVYVDRLPGSGCAEAFPVGTMIVKVVEVGEPDEWSVHAMVKRGGGYNPRSAHGWEFFDLDLSSNVDEPEIEWRGLGIVADYEEDDDTVCIACHNFTEGFDSILTERIWPNP